MEEADTESESLKQPEYTRVHEKKIKAGVATNKSCSTQENITENNERYREVKKIDNGQKISHFSL
jgi:hypothetical protein